MHLNPTYTARPGTLPVVAASTVRARPPAICNSMSAPPTCRHPQHAFDRSGTDGDHDEGAGRMTSPPS